MAGDQSATYDDADDVLTEALSLLDDWHAIVIDTGVSEYRIEDSDGLWEGPADRPCIRVDGAGVHPEDVEEIRPVNPARIPPNDAAVEELEYTVDVLAEEHGVPETYRAVERVFGDVPDDLRQQMRSAVRSFAAQYSEAPVDECPECGSEDVRSGHYHDSTGLLPESQRACRACGERWMVPWDLVHEDDASENQGEPA